MAIKFLPIPSSLKLPPTNSHFLQTSPKPLLNSLRFPFDLYSRIHSPKAYVSHLQLPQSCPSNQTPHDLSQAQESISDFLQEQGLSLEESLSVASNCPRYVKMLVDSIRDLEEWNSLNNSGECEGKKLGFKKMVISMAKEKGDNGKVAFLESLGLSLSSAIGVARYLSSEPLPALNHKVNYMKEIIFSGCDNKELIERKARSMMTNLSIPIDEDVQQTLSFFEKIEARRGGLGMLGSVDATFRCLVESFPRLLLLPVESHLKPMVNFLETVRISRRLLGNILLLFPPILFCEIQEIKRKALALNKVGAVHDNVGKMLLKYPWILSTSIQENYEQILSLFSAEKVPKMSVDQAIQSWPHLLGCSTCKLKLGVDLFYELGVKDKKLGRVIAKSPQLLLREPQELLRVILFLEDLGFDRVTVGKILCRCPELFATNIEKTLKSKVEFLTEFGISKDHLSRVIKKYPELLVSDVDRAMLPRIRYLMEIGISKRDVVFMVRRFSPLLGYSIEGVLRPKYEFLVYTMEKPVRDLVEYPRYFSYSLEKRIKPRFWVLKGRNIECSLKEMLAKNDEGFAAQFMGVERMLVPPSSSHQ
ncbi:hypothetical protein SLEP1_g36007 [Rubroshorea leprosula]|uniref:Uncharacterized protein n=1 Tax=Rubroshorea leprosula TaxID=152421 RepID=A0AAV5KQ37_9ROSI|nr:hypothetical protein SLEP1_g36007 [Rubroshorea leprosula]